jgi:hypothetical protein
LFFQTIWDCVIDAVANNVQRSVQKYGNVFLFIYHYYVELNFVFRVI